VLDRELLYRLRRTRWANLVIVNLRILLGFAFLPAGLKKVLGEPFTDPAKTGAFHEFLHAFHATGTFYQFVGVMQLAIAVLLLTQTLVTLGALMALPVFATVAVFCWSTGATFTAAMATLMLLGTAALLAWDIDRWRAVIEPPAHTSPPADEPPPLDMGLWRRCGVVILGLYLAVTALSGGIYRPVGVELQNPAFYILPLIALLPVVTFAVEQRASRRR
jgi:uncharacterized membrane protein YphA (DoxX/SURF4 family)